MEEVREVYRRCMTADFPDNERKPLGRIETALREGRYLCYGCFWKDELCGYAFFAYLPGKQGREYLLDYLAVLKNKRGKGVGSNFLRALERSLPDAACVIGEVENPDYAGSKAERERRERRIRFYRRSGIEDTGVTVRLFGVEYRVLEQPVRARHEAAEIREIYDRLYRSILPAELYSSKVLIHQKKNLTKMK
ncbi:GNAT family N-acetyltransferase [Lachnoclostridium sp. Marseille-P6806]|uniref:GNAT family N-acetyltransferase n=1 Tax=Lachnoclostridium sp. Marseille-P6806 TaxID=2364793 RepID=UPI00103051DE|nr:GNAT family N-acetyltransferase [Lachnoclostridium sp. Marseille-P6806]